MRTLWGRGLTLGLFLLLFRNSCHKMSVWAFPAVPVLGLLLLAASAGRGQPVVGMQREVRLLGRAESCRGVSISAQAVCASGLVCNPSTGTCVPVPASYQLLKFKWENRAVNKDAIESDSILYNKWRPSRPIQAVKNLDITAWSLNKIPPK